MNTRDIQTIYNYNDWANEQILAAAAKVTPAQYLAPTTHSYGNLQGTLVHILDAELSWRTLFETGTFDGYAELQANDFPTFDVLQKRWTQETHALRAYLSRLTDADLNGYVRYLTDTGEKRERVLWHCLFHLVNHGTQHRSEAAVILTDAGSSPGEMDFTVFLNARPQ